MVRSCRFVFVPPRSGVSAHPAIGQNNTMAGNDKRQGIGCHAVANGPSGARRTRLGGKFPVGSGLAVANLPTMLRYAALKVCLRAEVD